MKTEEYADLVIPELEDAPRRVLNYWWNAKDDAILRKYYSTRTLKSLVAYFAKRDKPRTKSSITSRASVLGLTRPRQEPCQKK